MNIIRNKYIGIYTFIKICMLTMSFVLTFMYMKNLSYAKEIDFQKEYLFSSKPKSSFEILKDNTCVGKANDLYYDSSIYNFDQKPNEIILNKGDIIKINDKSIPSLGQEIIGWDLQIYMPNGESKLYLYDNQDDTNMDIKLDKVGEWNIYLNVKDDTSLIGGFENVSTNGNHRWLGKSKEIEDTYIWWYFSQIKIIVKDTSNINDTDEIEINDEPDANDYEKNPITEIYIPEIIYSKDFTEKSDKYKNVIRWDYYDENNRSIKDGGYKLYKYINGRKELMCEESGKVKSIDREIVLTGDMNDKFYLYVWVKNDLDLIGTDEKKIEINKIYPKIEAEIEDRLYIEEYLKGKINDDYVFPNAYLNYEYINYEIVGSNKEVLLSQKGRFNKEENSTFITKEKFNENEFYTLIQNIKFKDEVISVSSKFYVVEILKPIVSVKNISGYYQKEYATDLYIEQRQSKLKGNLNDYILKIDIDNTWYEIYEINNDVSNIKLVKKEKGLLEKIKLDEINGITKIQNENEKGQYKYVQYATNSKGKTGVAEGYIEIKYPTKGSLNIEILERDNDVYTLKDEIYPKESLLLNCIIEEGYEKIKDKWYEIKQKKLIKNINIDANINDGNNIEKTYEWVTIKKEKGKINGLIQMDYEPGEYVIIQYAKDENDNVFQDEVNYKIKEIEKPKILIRNIKGTVDKEKESNENIFYYGESVELDVEINDINRSEEHPSGFYVKSNYYIADSSISNQGIFSIINADSLLKNKEYLLIQNAENSEHEKIKAREEYKFIIKNKKPILKVISPNEICIGESDVIRIEVSDTDGYIKEFNYEFNNENITIEDKKIILDEVSHKIIEIKFKAIKEGNVKLDIYTKDDNDDECSSEISIDISYTEVPINLYIENESIIELKQDRYIKWLCVGTNSDELIFEYSFINNENENENVSNYVRMVPSENMFYEDKNIKGYFDVIKPNYISFSMFFKISGEYKFRAKGIKKDLEGKWKTKDVIVREDSIPNVEINTQKELVRNFDTKRVEIKGKLNITGIDVDESKVYIFISKDKNKLKNLEDTINYEEYVQKVLCEKEKDNNYTFFHETEINNLGTYYLRAYVTNKQKQLPDKEHPLYNELLERVKKEYSEIYEINAINIKPILMYNTVNRNVEVIRYYEK